MRIWLIWTMTILVAWACSYQGVLEKAIDSKQLVWVFVENEKCPWCKKMRAHIIKSGFYKRRLSQKYVLVVLTTDEAKDCNLDIKYYPSSFLIEPKSNKILDFLPGYMKPIDFLDLLNIVYEQFFEPETALE